jgi:hypothetical protein
MTDKAWSIDEESYEQDWHETLTRLDEHGGLEPGATIYEGDVVQRKPSDFLHGPVDWLLEHMGEAAWEEAGEFAETWPECEVTPEKKAELDKLIADWMDANIKVRFYTVSKVRKVALTEADIAEYRGDPADGVSVPQPPGSGS